MLVYAEDISSTDQLGGVTSSAARHWHFQKCGASFDPLCSSLEGTVFPRVDHMAVGLSYTAVFFSNWRITWQA